MSQHSHIGLCSLPSVNGRVPLSKPVLVPFLGPALGPRDFVFNSWAPKRYLKMEPKQCPNWTQIKTPKRNPGPPTLSEDADKVRVDMIFSQWPAQQSYSTVCSKPRTSTKERKISLGRGICSNKERAGPPPPSNGGLKGGD